MQILNFCAFYYTVQLVRCVMISVVVSVFVIVLRKTVLKDKIFLKGAAWALFIPTLFAGRMKFFDESRIGVILSAWWKMITINHVWICWLYFGITFLYAGSLICKRIKLKKLVAGTERREWEGTFVYVTSIPVTPFTVGIFRPRIVIPEVILKEYGREEIRTILLHEKIHIKLGHLLLYLLWDVLRVMLWLNPLLTISTGLFREDLEEICDKVTIHSSQEKAHTYGELLLKSMRILQEESKGFNMYASFAGNKEYRNIRERIARIAGYKPYKQTAAVGVWFVALFCLAGSVLGIKALSYGRNIENDSVLIYGYENGNVTFVDYSDALYQMISYDNDHVYVDSAAFDSFLRENNAAGEIYIVFGGFLKLPGIGGHGYSCLYENVNDEKTVQIPYENYEDNWFIKLYKML